MQIFVEIWSTGIAYVEALRDDLNSTPLIKFLCGDQKF